MSSSVLCAMPVIADSSRLLRIPARCMYVVSVASCMSQLIALKMSRIIAMPLSIDTLTDVPPFS